jgi:hypothetical protein
MGLRWLLKRKRIAYVVGFAFSPMREVYHFAGIDVAIKRAWPVRSPHVSRFSCGFTPGADQGGGGRVRDVIVSRARAGEGFLA